MRGRPAPKRWGLGCGRRGGRTGSVPRPPGKGAPGLPGLRCQLGTPAMLGAPPEEGPAPGVAGAGPGRAPGLPLPGAWDAGEHGRGREPHAPSPRPCTASRRPTGDGVRARKASGPEARAPPTTRQGPHGESEGAEEAAAGHAVPTGRVPRAQAPRLGQYGGQRETAHRVPRARGSWPRAVDAWRLAPGEQTQVQS